MKATTARRGQGDVRSRRAISRVGLTTAVALGLLAAACSSSGTSNNGSGAGGPADEAKPTVGENAVEPDEPIKDGGKIVIAVTGETSGWNPGLNQWADAGVIVGASVLESLMYFDGNGDTKPWLAESVEPTTPGDYSKWTVKLKPDVKFHDGTTMDAKAVQKSMEFSHIKSPLNSLALAADYEKTDVIDANTVQINLRRQWASYPTVLAGQVGTIFAPSMLDSEDQGVSHPVGTGPFEFNKWVPDKSLTVTKFKDYWQKGLPHLDSIEFQPIVDSKTRINALEAGNVDLVMTNRAQDVADTKAKYPIVKDWNSEKTHLLLNVLEDSDKAATDPTKRNPFKNVHARRALAYATDRQRLVNVISFGEELQLSSTPQVKGTRFEMDEADAHYYPFDPEKAKAEIEEFKKDTGYEKIEFTFSGLQNNDDIQIMQALTQMWEEVGIEGHIQTVEQTAYISQLVLGAYQVGYFRNYAYKDPENTYVFWSSTTAKGLGVLSINFTQFKDDKIDENLEKARTSPDQKVRADAYKIVAQRINEEAVNIWLFNTPFSLIAQPNLRGLNQARKEGFGNFLPKPWLLPSLWKSTT